MVPIKLKEWRQYLGWSQEALSEASGVARSNIARLEQPGHRHAARPSTRRRLAAAMGIGVHELVTVPPAMAQAERGGEQAGE